ncbi:MAG: XRE family transcriptional regulator [Rhodospirillales bacterium]|nr:XRE family transcriptional regulator [Rhodospirillales bacterium]
MLIKSPRPATRPAGPKQGADSEIGGRLRLLRRRRRVTLQALSDASGISVGMLSQIERGLSSPSIRTLQSVAAALDVPIGWFFSPPQDSAGCPPWVLRRTARRVLSLGSNGVVKELVSPGAGAIELLMVTIEPGGSSGGSPYTHEGEDAGVVLEGQMRLEVDGEACLLGAGDAFRFKSTLPHRFDNPGPLRALVLWALTPPLY